MTTKRFILMMLVMLMSVTGAWAYYAKTACTIVSNQLTVSPDPWGSFYSCNSSPANMVIKADHAIYLGQVYICARYGAIADLIPEYIKIEGSNDQSAWTEIQGTRYGHEDTYVIVSTFDKYQYFRLTFSSRANAMEFEYFEIYEDKIDRPETSQDPYTLNNVGHLKQYAELIAGGNNTACAKLTTDLDLGTTTFASIDNANFVGSIDGGGYTIKNLKSANGLFKSIGAATIKNLTIENATLSATDEYSGVLAAQANGTTFQNCIVKGTISASSANVGGLVGNAYGATFTQCYSVGAFSVGNANCGGLVGMASGNTQLTQCYCVGHIDETRPTFVSTTTPNSYLDSNPPSNLVDAGGTDTRWCAKTEHKDEDDVWNIVVTTGVATQLKSIRLWNADNQTYPKRRWKSIKVYGSASSNGDWTELKSDDNLNLAINNKGLAGKIEVNATQSYTYYKIDVLKNEGDDYMQMSDMTFVVSSQHLRQLPVCGASDGSCTATLCYHYGSASSSLSTAVEQADVTSGRLAYLLNNGDCKGPYFQRIGTDAYPSLTNTGDGDDYVYLALDDATYTNDCPHRNCSNIPLKAPTCVGALGNAEYNQCTNSLCKKYLWASNRNIVVSDVKQFTLSNKAVNIQQHNTYSKYGIWKFSESERKDNTTYYNVMSVSHINNILCNGDYVISYTSVDDDPTMNLHLFFSSDMGAGGFSVRFYVNGIERSASRINYPNSTSERHDEVSIDGLHKFDIIKVVYTFSHSRKNSDTRANFFIGTQKPILTSHNLQKHEVSYNCIDGGCKEHYECSRCEYIFAKNTPTSDADITTLSALALAPVGAHNFGSANPDTQKEDNLYGVQCQNEHCTAFDPDHYVLKNYHNDTDLPLAYDGSTYSTSSPVSLTDGKAYVTPVEFSAADIEYTRTFYTNVWNPWFVPFTATVEELADNGVTDVATIESIHNYDTDDDGVVDKTVLEVIKKKNGTVKAGVPYMVKTGDNYTYPMEFSDRVMDASNNIKTLHSETISAAYDFMGTYSGLIAADLASSNHYSLNEEGKMVHRTLNILPQRWYMKEVGKENVYEELSPAMARAFAIRVIGEEDETTGIRTIYPEDGQKEERLPEGIFDLNGRKLSAPHSGQINIINGKKHFVR